MKKVMNGIRYSFYIWSHPIRGFYEMRFEHQGNLASCFVLLIFMIMAFVCQQLYTGLSFQVVNVRDFNILRQIANALIPVILWCIANWSITVLMDGEGRFIDIFMATCYATVPYTVTTFIAVILSRVLVADEATFISIVANIGIFFTALLIFIGMLTIHQFSVRQSLFALVLTVAAMVFIAFLTVLFLSVLNQMISYFKGIIVELELRM